MQRKTSAIMCGIYSNMKLLGLPAADRSSFVMLAINMFWQKIKICMDSVARFSQYSTGL